MTTRRKVAVLGGGLGAMTAAFELTATPELREQFEVTVYTQGWRLGGKGASGRNRRIADRIEEHGLHAFLGFYENAFSLVRRMYGEWEKKPENPFRTWQDAFHPQRLVSLAESPDENGRWRAAAWTLWNIDVPPLPGTPGLGFEAPSPAEYLALLLEWLRARLDETKEELDAPPPSLPSHGLRALFDQAMHALHERGSRPGGSGSTLLDQAHAIARWLDLCPEEHSKAHTAGLLEVLDDLDALSKRARLLTTLGDDARRLVTLLEIGAAVARGIVAEILPPGSGGFAAIDGHDFKEWLERHGARREVAWSAPIRALYDLGFAYEGGRRGRDNARASAAVALKVMLSLVLRSKGAPLWKMQAGMGDTLFSPLWEILVRQRGVRIELFRRVASVRPTPDGAGVDSVELIHQVQTLGDYEPLYDVGGLPCWPSEPDWKQIENGEATRARLLEQRLTLESAWCHEEVGRETLQRGKDFDVVVLGLSIGELPHACPELVAARDEWQRMVAEVKTVQTQALQLWLSRPLAGLGWTAGSTIMTSYAEPFDTWGEMSHLVPRERWPDDHPARSIEYFCSPMQDAVVIPPFDDPSFPGTQADRVREDALAWLHARVGALWPDATRADQPRGLDWSLLVDLEGRSGEARLDSQFWRANVDPTERYVLSIPASTRHRLAPGGSGFENLVLAGDWTATSLSAGCAEAAIESGMLAAQALSGFPKQIARH